MSDAVAGDLEVDENLGHVPVHVQRRVEHCTAKCIVSTQQETDRDEKLEKAEVATNFGSSLASSVERLPAICPFGPSPSSSR